MRFTLPRRIFGATLLAAATLALTAGAAMAHDNAITAASSCTSQKAATWTASYTVVNDYGLSEVATVTFSNGAATQFVNLGPHAQATISVSGTGSSSVTASETGHWSDGYRSPAHAATAYRPNGCTPVTHTPTIRGTSVCSTSTGTYAVTYSVVDLQGGTPSVSLPLTRTLPGNTTSDSLSVNVTYSNGPDEVANATVPMSGTCKRPPPPCTIKNGCKAFYSPTATFNGPCGDPFYRAVFNNTASNRAVKFVYRYHVYGGGWRNITVMVAAHKTHTTRYVHVLGGSHMSVYAGHKGLVAFRVAAPAGNYRACR